MGYLGTAEKARAARRLMRVNARPLVSHPWKNTLGGFDAQRRRPAPASAGADSPRRDGDAQNPATRSARASRSLKPQFSARA